MSNDSQKCAPNFGAGQKNNPSHGPVAQVTMAPLYIDHGKVARNEEWICRSQIIEYGSIFNFFPAQSLELREVHMHT